MQPHWKIACFFVLASAFRANSENDSTSAGFTNLPTCAISAAPDSISKPPLFSLTPAESLHKSRLWLGAGVGGGVYAGMSVALWKAWYQDYPLTHFHLFNDWGEWADMDKAGHFFSAYSWSKYGFSGARWTGMKRKNALWTAVAIGTGVQATIEVMDGFSEKWGFSLGDVGFNTLGVSFFAAQELLWQEQRIQVKASGFRPDYSDEPIFSSNGSTGTTNLDERAAGLYGTSVFHVLPKDYNALTIWCSGNVRSFLKNENSRFPRWLNVAVGYGADNIYGGFENAWEENGSEFALDPADFPRYRQFYLSPDVDFTKIPTRHRWLKMSLGLLNILKFPAPALEVNTLGKVRFHPFHW